MHHYVCFKEKKKKEKEFQQNYQHIWSKHDSIFAWTESCILARCFWRALVLAQVVVQSKLIPVAYKHLYQFSRSWQVLFFQRAWLTLEFLAPWQPLAAPLAEELLRDKSPPAPERIPWRRPSTKAGPALWRRALTVKARRRRHNA